MPSISQNKTNWNFLLIVIVLIVFVGTGIYFLLSETTEPVGCTMEAKRCPDGSYVGRIPPDCEFTECPPVIMPDETADLIPNEVEGWQTYRNEEHGFEIKYPDNWIISETEECSYQFRKDFKTVVHLKPEWSQVRERYICIDIANNEEQLSLVQYFEGQKKEIEENGHVIYFPFVDLDPTETFVINNRTFYRFWIPGVIGTVNVFTDCKKHIFNIYSYAGKEEFFEIKDQVITAFKFLE